MLMKAHKALNRFNLELNLEKYLKVINFCDFMKPNLLIKFYN